MTETAAIASQNDEFERYQKNLERVQQSIKKVQQHLKSSRYKRGHVVTELKQLEGEISKNSKKLNRTETRIQELTKRISTLEADIGQIQRDLTTQRQGLAQQIRAAYGIGHQQEIKMFLNQQDAASFGRVLIYFDYLNQARQDQISAFLSNIAKHEQLENELNTHLADFQQNLKKRKKQKNSLLSQRLKKNQLLARLEQKISNQEKNLTDLEGSRGRIEKLLKSLGELLADIPQNPSDIRPFKQQKGRLPWPASGPFLATYGEAREQGGLRWNGVLISTKHGTPVRAVSHGRIAFADWLQGFGFIAIIDHGDGYMSLYGHNETLLKRAGDWIEAGEAIATSGDSGGQPLPGVYFEIRYRGKPINPRHWCSRSVKFAANLK
jgi:septal ring factor EnvC (AmiA/AmiB activator)